MTAPNKIPARYIMLGGFLGAGKTTTLIQLAKHLQAQQKRVGIITNDQAAGLVDTAVVRAQDVAVEEIAGGCFCCRFPSLKAAAENLQQQHKPEVFLGEPVGSCTDLVATVSYPLRRLYGDEFTIAPLSVVLDAKRALRMLGLREGKRFSDKVRYIYLKQIEESHALLINKTDLITEAEREEIVTFLSLEYPDKKLFCISAVSGDGLDPWINWVLNHEIGNGTSLDINYQAYADGEAALAWLNASLHLTFEKSVDGNQLLAHCMSEVSSQLIDAEAMIAHLKMTLSPEDGSGEIASANMVDNESVPLMGQQLLDDIKTASLMINIRAETNPDILKKAIQSLEHALSERGALSVVVDDVECFKPAAPVPVHRMETMDEVH